MGPYAHRVNALTSTVTGVVYASRFHRISPAGRTFMDGWTTLLARCVIELVLPSTTERDHASVYFAGQLFYN